MKLSSVLFLIVFSCVIFFVSDISADHDADGPYEAFAQAERIGLPGNTIQQTGCLCNTSMNFPFVHVRLYASASCGDPAARNGSYILLYHGSNGSWRIEQTHLDDPGHLIQGDFFYGRTEILWYQLNLTNVGAGAFGETGGTESGSQPTNTNSHSAIASDAVAAWVPPPMPDIIIKPCDCCDDDDDDGGDSGGCDDDGTNDGDDDSDCDCCDDDGGDSGGCDDGTNDGDDDSDCDCCDDDDDDGGDSGGCF